MDIHKIMVFNFGNKEIKPSIKVRYDTLILLDIVETNQASSQFLFYFNMRSKISHNVTRLRLMTQFGKMVFNNFSELQLTWIWKNGSVNVTSKVWQPQKILQLYLKDPTLLTHIILAVFLYSKWHILGMNIKISQKHCLYLNTYDTVLHSNFPMFLFLYSHSTPS